MLVFFPRLFFLVSSLDFSLEFYSFDERESTPYSVESGRMRVFVPLAGYGWLWFSDVLDTAWLSMFAICWVTEGERVAISHAKVQAEFRGVDRVPNGDCHECLMRLMRLMCLM